VCVVTGSEDSKHLFGELFGERHPSFRGEPRAQDEVAVQGCADGAAELRFLGSSWERAAEFRLRLRRETLFDRRTPRHGSGASALKAVSSIVSTNLTCSM
jgi:hypothetical protein